MLDDIFNKSEFLESNNDIFIKVLDKYYKQISIYDLIFVTKNSNLLIDKINSIDVNSLFNSYIHGASHAIRVSILANYIGKSYHLNNDQIELLIDSAIYHDIGRINDLDDVEHGYRSSLLIDNIIFNKDLVYMNNLKAIITSHSYDDSYDEDIISHYDYLYDNIRFLISIFKDSDALDRVRTNDLDSSYLRCNMSKSLIKTSYDLYNNMKKD